MATPQSDGSIVLTTKVVTTGIQKGINVIKNSIKTAAVALTALGAAAGYLVKQSVSAYAEFEQLVGGVETLFGESADKVRKYADEAYRTAGLSANEYMRNVTTFSASLLNSLGGDTDKAADVANEAIIAISDNVNKMGSDYQSVQLAFQGFAKQQYQLLDNLKLGYGGTKTEMERLLKDAQAITGVEYNIDNLADVYTAIGVIQEKLGIAGTTAKEASTTISGSAATMKAAWSNVLTAISGGGDIDTAIENLVNSVEIYFHNIVPVVERALVGVGVMIERIAPMLVQTVANAFIRALPQLINAAISMLSGLVQGIISALEELLSGKQINKKLTQQAETVKKITTNNDKLNKSIEETGKALKDNTAAFDELNILSSKTAQTEGQQSPASTYSMETIGGSGGTLDSGPIVSEVDAMFMQILDKVATGMMALGCILLATGNIAWGVGLIIAGAIASEYAEAQVGDGSSLSELIETISKVLVIAGTIAIILGILLCVAKMWGTGIKLIAIGAASVVGATTLNWDAIKSAIKEQSNKLAIAGVLLIVLGIFLCIANVWGFGIASIVAGIGVIVGVVALNWDAISEKMTEVFKDFAWIIAGAGVALIVIGILLCVGGAIPLGIGLIVMGAAALTGAILVNWNAIVDWVKGAWEAVKDFWNKHIAQIFTLKWWANLAIACGNGLISGFEAAINGIIWLFETMINWVVKGLNKISITIPDWIPGIGGKKFGIDIPLADFGEVSFGRIPALAKGAVIPPNREFLAVLGDQKHGVNIETPLDTMIEAFRTALSDGDYGGETSVSFTIELDGDTLYKGVKKAENKRAGISISNPAFAR